MSAVLILFGLWLRFGLLGYRFSSLICFALGALLACCGGLRLLPHPIGSILLAVVNGFVALGVLVVGITEIFILRAALRKHEVIISVALVDMGRFGASSSASV